MNKEYILIAFTENQIGVLNRITGYYLRRKINIESLKVSESSIKGISMFVISAYTTAEIIEKLTRQISNIVEVLDVSYYLSDELITQEIALYKVSSNLLGGNGRVDALLRQWGTRLIEFTPTYIVMEKSGNHQEIDNVKEELQKSGMLIEFTRSGSVVLHRESIDELLNEIIDNN